MKTTRPAATVLVSLLLLALAACSKAETAIPGAPAGWTRLSPSQLDERMRQGDVFLVNVHVPYEGEIPGTDAFIPYTDIAQHLDKLPADRSTLVLYCRSGNMSTQAAQALVDAGVTGFSELQGGFYGWDAAGFPFKVRIGGG